MSIPAILGNTDALLFFAVTIFFSCLTSAKRIINDKRFDTFVGSALINHWFIYSCLFSSCIAIITGLILFEQGIWKEYTLTNALLLGLFTVPILESIISNIPSQQQKKYRIASIESLYRFFDDRNLLSQQRKRYQQRQNLLATRVSIKKLEAHFKDVFADNEQELASYQWLVDNRDDSARRMFLIKSLQDKDSYITQKLLKK